MSATPIPKEMGPQFLAAQRGLGVRAGGVALLRFLALQQDKHTCPAAPVRCPASAEIRAFGGD
jgi:hypothetical protein